MDIPTYKISLNHKFYTKLRSLQNLPQAINNPTLVTLTPAILTALPNPRIYQLANYQKLAMHRNGESLNRRSLHKSWKSELISKEDSTIDGTSMPEKGGQYKLCQQPGLE